MNASSESGLCATLISRALPAELLIGAKSPTWSNSTKHSDLQELPKRLAAQNVVCIRRATAAASITFITSAKMNGANPNATARCQLPVTTASHEIPAANRTSSATAPPIRFRTNDRLPCSEIQPARNATTGYASRYPPVGPKSWAIPPTPAGLNTGRPIAPHARYSAAAANPRLLPNERPTSRTPKFANVNGTGVNGNGSI